MLRKIFVIILSLCIIVSGTSFAKNNGAIQDDTHVAKIEDSKLTSYRTTIQHGERCEPHKDCICYSYKEWSQLNGDVWDVLIDGTIIIKNTAFELATGIVTSLTSPF